MPSCRSGCILLSCVIVAMLGSAAASGQYAQGCDVGTTCFADPDTWTRAILPDTQDTVTFLLNPCEHIIYMDTAGKFQTCMPRPACDHLEDMEEKLEQAFDWWRELDTEDALTFVYGGVVDNMEGIDCPATPVQCPAADGWTDDGEWVVTRTYLDDLDPIECPDADSEALESLEEVSLEGAGCFQLYEDDSGDHTTRSIREADIVFPARKWENDPVLNGEKGCTITNGYDLTECEVAWTLELVHEVGHCLGFLHSWQHRKILKPFVRAEIFSASGLTILDGENSVMSYDRPGQIESILAQGELLRYDQALYLEAYSSSPDPEGIFFAAHGTVVIDAEDNDCDDQGGLEDPEPLFGALVIALEETATEDEFIPVQISLTGVDPLEAGEFRLERLVRGEDYRLVVIDGRNENWVNTRAIGFDDMTLGGHMSFPVRRTDLWSEENSGPQFSYSMPAAFDTGYDYVVSAEFTGPNDPEEGPFGFCVELLP